MWKNKYHLDDWRKLLNKGISALSLAFILLIGLTPALEASSTSAQPASPDVTLGRDDGLLEVGVWYVQQYQNCGNFGLRNLSATSPDALGLANTLSAQLSPVTSNAYQTARWRIPIIWGNSNAWEEDWKAATLGGQENAQMDSVDFAYFAGHGSASGFFVGAGGNVHDDCQITAEDALLSWGDQDNDWVGISACNVLNDPESNVAKWANAMHGTRLLMSFKTVMADVPFGFWLGDSIRRGHSFTYAWFRTTDLQLPAGQTARIIAERNDYYNDLPNMHNAPTEYDNTFSYWTHYSGQNEALPSASAASAGGGIRPLRSSDLAGEMPVFLVEPLSAAEANDQYETVANAFNLTSTVPARDQLFASSIEAMDAPDGLYTSPNGDLVMDSAAGNFQYANSELLWNQSEVVKAASADNMTAIDDNTAIDIANNFLQSNNLMPGDAFSPQAQEEMIVTAQQPGRQSGASAASLDAPMQILDEELANYQIVYSRIITFSPPAVNAAAANAGPVGAKVVGPGAKLMVYVAPQAPLSATAASLLDETVLGGMGGYRRVQEATVADTHAPLTTPILPLETIETLLDKIERKVALDFVDLPFNSREVISDSLSYWEGPIGWNQDQLIPVYVLRVRATLGTGAGKATQDYDVYIPVNASYMAPYAEIKPPTGVLFPGQKITLEAADAGKTLAALGVDPSLDFVLGSGDSDSYLYTWYLNEVADENIIGNGRTTDFTVPNGDTNGKAASIRIILTVTDASAPRTSGNTGTDEINLNFSKTFMPALQGPQNK